MFVSKSPPQEFINSWRDYDNSVRILPQSQRASPPRQLEFALPTQAEFVICDCTIEVDNFYLKTQLGLTDFRVRSYEAVDKYMVVVLLTWAYVERRFCLERSPQIKTYGDLIRRHRNEHAIDWLTGALTMMQEVGDIQQVLQHFLRLEPQPA